MQRLDWDHIDPDYPEGSDRPYQLVCGLTNEFNLLERNNSINVRKSNRFLPWKVAQDEVGSVPVNPGDLCQFLDRATGEWVLEEFMGEWWFEQTKDLCGQSSGGKRTAKEKLGLHNPAVRVIANSNGGKATPRAQLQEMGRRSNQVQKERKIGLYGRSSKDRSEIAKKARKTLISRNPDLYSEILRKGGETVNKQKHMCLMTGHISTPAGLSNYQRHRGIDLTRRIQLTPEECAFIFLWAS
jgi:hypothetical protein